MKPAKAYRNCLLMQQLLSVRLPVSSKNSGPTLRPGDLKQWIPSDYRAERKRACGHCMETSATGLSFITGTNQLQAFVRTADRVPWVSDSPNITACAAQTCPLRALTIYVPCSSISSLCISRLEISAHSNAKVGCSKLVSWPNRQLIGELPAIDPEIITTLSGSSRTGNSISTLSGSYGSLLGAISWATSAGFSSETTAYVFQLTGSCSCSCGMLSAYCYFY